MIIQIDTDKTINGEERLQSFYTNFIQEELKRFDSHLTRIEVHLSDENGEKESQNQILCLIEARVEGRQPLVVSAKGDQVEKAVSAAVLKIKGVLEKTVSRMKHH